MPGGKLFLDREFPPDASSLGEIGCLNDGWMNLETIIWCRVKEVLGYDWDTQPLLIEDGITPTDVNQGGLGNCWLLGALACIARRFPELIERRFTAPRDPETGKPTISATGRYIIQLWDVRKKEWVNIVIDDLIPCLPVEGNPRPLFATADGNEAWLLLLEKAFAKYFGSYAALEGGWSDVMFKIIGGDRVEDFLSYYEPNGEEPWYPSRTCVKVKSKTADRAVLGLCDRRHEDANKAISTVKMFEKLRKWVKDPNSEFIIGAASKGNDDSVNTNSIVCGHAYAVLDVVMLSGFTLLKLANPHGTGGKEWQGAWSNTDTKSWKDNTEVAEACKWAGSMAGTGIFWMQEIDFDRHFDSLNVARLSKGDKAALEKLSGTDSDRPPLESGEWDGEADEESDDEPDVNETEQHFRSVFDAYADGRGTLYREELIHVLTTFTGTQVPRKLVNQLLNAVGLDYDDQVSYSKLMEMVGLVPAVSCFMKYDADGRGSLSKPELVRIAKHLQDRRVAHRSRRRRAAAKLMGYVTGIRKEEVEETIEDMIQEYDQDDDGEISFREFLGIARDYGLC